MRMHNFTTHIALHPKLHESPVYLFILFYILFLYFLCITFVYSVLVLHILNDPLQVIIQIVKMMKIIVGTLIMIIQELWV